MSKVSIYISETYFKKIDMMKMVRGFDAKQSELIRLAIDEYIYNHKDEIRNNALLDFKARAKLIKAKKIFRDISKEEMKQSLMDLVKTYELYGLSYNDCKLIWDELKTFTEEPE